VGAVPEDAEEQPVDDDVEGPPEDGSGDRSTDPLLLWAASHVPLLATTLLFLFVVVRVLRVSEFDPGTATTVVREAGVVSVVLGVLATSLPSLVMIAALFLLLVGLGGPGTDVQRRVALITALSAYVLLTAILPWPRLIAVTVTLLVVFLVWRKIRWPLEYFAVVALVVTALLDVPRVWLPAEDVRLAESRVTAYVLSVESDWMTLLREGDRSIMIVKITEVESRNVCNVDGVSEARTIGQILLGERGGPRNPPCPS
jgi:hypothetical protein